ncbi:MAG TPA: hypothetical protein VF167_00015, partial [Longimicrobiaceae bacterium]
RGRCPVTPLKPMRMVAPELQAHVVPIAEEQTEFMTVYGALVRHPAYAAQAGRRVPGMAETTCTLHHRGCACREAAWADVARQLEEARGEIARLTQWVHDLQSGMWINCVYCGHRYGPRESTAPTMQQALYEHVRVCPKHPLAAAERKITELEEQLRSKSLTEVWVAASGTDYEYGRPEDAFATEAAALAWLRARREEVIEKQVRWIDDPEEAARFRESFPEIVSEDGAHRLRNIDEWWSVVRHPLADLVPNGHEAAR